MYKFLNHLKLLQCNALLKGSKCNAIHLRNEFSFWNVHKIMNTSGLVQSK